MGVWKMGCGRGAACDVVSPPIEVLAMLAWDARSDHEGLLHRGGPPARGGACRDMCGGTCGGVHGSRRGGEAYATHRQQCTGSCVCRPHFTGSAGKPSLPKATSPDYRATRHGAWCHRRGVLGGTCVRELHTAGRVLAACVLIGCAHSEWLRSAHSGEPWASSRMLLYGCLPVLGPARTWVSWMRRRITRR